jgi:C4-dicarboxylate-specific signal transduction histidine kinase
MISFQNISIKRKLIILMMLSSSVALLLALAGFSAYEILKFRDSMLQQLSSIAELLSEPLAKTTAANDSREVEKILARLKAEPGVLGACVFRADGRVLALYSREGSGGFTPPEFLRKAYIFRKEKLLLYHPLQIEDRLVGTVLLQSDRAALTDRLNRYAGIALIILICSLAISWALSYALQREVSHPILDLLDTAHQVAAHQNYSLRARKQSNDELGRLVDGFNHMLSQIEARDLALHQAQNDLERKVNERTRELRMEIAQRKKSEAENQKLACFPELNPNPVLEFSVDGVLIYFNEAAHQLAISLQTTHPIPILPRDHGDIVKECVRTGRSRMNHETVIKNRTISWSFFPIQSSQAVHCYAVEITERLNLEAKVRQAQKMESVGQLAAGVAHDFNNILTIIQGYTSLLQASGQFNAEQKESLNLVAEATHRAANLTRQLLTFSRRQVMQPRVIDLNEVVSHMTNMLRRILGENISFHCNYPMSLPPVYADVTMVEQIIVNLAVNARDAMPHGGQLSVSTAIKVIDEAYVQRNSDARPGTFVVLTVSDTGCGMDARTMNRLFEPFFTTKEVGKGTGLGLATVYGIVKQHEGWIEVTSQPHHGSTFVIFIPAYCESVSLAELHPPKPALPEPQGGRERILLVEDETAVRGMARRVLQNYGYEVLEASSGVDALAVWRRATVPIDLLLTDMVMPEGMSGRELADQLQCYNRRLKILYTTGYSLEIVGRDFALQPGIHFLPKPYEPTTLAQAVRQCLDS